MPGKTRTKPETQAQRVARIRADINGHFGKEVLHNGSDERFITRFIPTGIVPIDIILGGGMPRNRFVECYGDWSTLKSYIGYKAIAAAQKQGGVAALMDTEHAYDKEWAQECGINTSELLLEQPDTGEMAFDIVESLIRQDVDFIDFDSVASMLPQVNRDKRLADERPQVAAMGSLMSLAMRKITAPNKHTAVYFCNQLRTNVGITFGNPDVPSGGRSLPYYAAMRLQIRKHTKVTKQIKTWNGEKLADGKEQIAQQYIVSVDKSKLNKPHRSLMFTWSLIDGSIDETLFLISQGVELGFIEIKGSMWSIKNSKRSIRGRDAFAKFIASNDRAQDQLRNKVLGHHGMVDEQPEPARKQLIRKAQ